MNKWSKRYMSLAREISLWSKDPSAKVGAIAVGAHRQVIAQGYNGFPRGVDDSIERYEDKKFKYQHVVHAEMNCIYNAGLTGTSLNEATMYVYGIPTCASCAPGIIQVGIKNIIMQASHEIRPLWEENFLLTKAMFKEVGMNWMYYDMNGELVE